MQKMAVLLLASVLLALVGAASAGQPGSSLGRAPRDLGRLDVCDSSPALRLKGGSWFSGTKAATPEGTSAVKEPVTGITFPGSIQAGGKSLELIGCGERKKKIVGPMAVNVYAIGMYVDQVTAVAAGKGLSSDAAAAKMLSEGSFTKTLRLVMARSVNAEKIGDALADQIEPRVKGTGAPVDAFKGFFKAMNKLESQQVVTFTQSGGHTLIVSAPGNRNKQFTSAPLCKAMFDIYLGDTPVSDNAKKAMTQGFLKLVNA